MSKAILCMFLCTLFTLASSEFVFEDIESVRELIKSVQVGAEDATIEEIYASMNTDQGAIDDLEPWKSYNKRFSDEAWNTRPMIGILSQPRNKNPPYTTYVMAAYVKFIEQTGARAVGIKCNDTDDDIADLMRNLNGVLIPGGDIEATNPDGTLSPYTQKVKFIIDYAKQLNDEGNYYPVWAICQGFEQLSLIEGPTLAQLVHSSAKNVPRNLVFVKQPAETRLYKTMPERIIRALENEYIAYHNNEFRVSPESFEKDPGLQNYDVIAISYDRDGRAMVASIEHKHYPIYSHQWHPEKNQFVWLNTLPVPHSKVAIDMVHYFAEFFVTECRKNNNKFATYKLERKHMIQNQPVTVSDGSLQDIYLF